MPDTKVFKASNGTDGKSTNGETNGTKQSKWSPLNLVVCDLLTNFQLIEFSRNCPWAFIGNRLYIFI